ncbi:hypothetical protein UlMin_043695 [Ulmus minor]
MDTFISASKHKNYLLFLNISFLAFFGFLVLQFYSQQFVLVNTNHTFLRTHKPGCNGLDHYQDKCFYLKSKNPCVHQGFIDYLQLFYCNFGTLPLLGFALLFLWLLVLFYILGNTASEYFCSSLESISSLFKLSPTIAGVTLLSLGNGAPDVFASIASFAGGEATEVGVSTIVGGASFVSCVVVGVISIAIRRRSIQVSKSDFVRDIFFLLLANLCLAVILLEKDISVWDAVTFSSIYIAYVIVVYVLHRHSNNSSPESDLTVPILEITEKGELKTLEEGVVEDCYGTELKKRCCCLRSSPFCVVLVSILEMPLYLPRRLTIPVICEERWSKGYAVVSVTLAPLLLSTLVNYQIGNGAFSVSQLVIYGVGLVLGLVFGIAAFVTTESSCPPRKCLFPWLAAGFLMSVAWSYITAQELVGLLVSLAYIFGINPSILGFTVLAWGNSIGDLVTNLTMALNGGPEGAQIAFSGCYAGPIFNTLFGLGMSLLGYCWSNYPSSIVIAKDPYLLQTLGFLAAGLIWALMVLPRRDMRIDGVFGGGLLVIYSVCISLRVFQAFGDAQLDGISSS